MMQLICNNLPVDLTQGTAVSFTKKNILFAFDSIECERTASFTIPATQHNNTIIFGRANLYESDSQGMRQRYDAVFIDGIVRKTGYIYITQYDPQNKAYTAVFVTGDNLLLKQIKEAGKLKNILTASTFGATATYNRTPDSSHKDFGTYNYTFNGQSGTENFPSISLASILSACATQLGCVIVQPAEIAEYYLLPQSLVDSAGNEVAVGGTARAYDNLPDLTLVDLLKIVAAITGRLLLVDGNTITFDSSALANWRAQELAGLISIKSVEKKFCDYAQDNYITAKGARKEFAGLDVENTGFGDLCIIQPASIMSRAIKSNYHIDNVNIDKKKVLYNMPVYGVGAIAALSSRDAVTIGKRNATSLATISVYQPANYYSMPVNANIQQLCTTATAIKADVRISLMQFEAIKPKDLICLNCSRYVWTAATWANGVASFELSRL